MMLHVKLRYCRVLLVGLLVFGCATREQLGLGSLQILSAGVVNDPKNKSLRFDLLQFGLEQFCSEMLRRGAPLSLSDSQPVLGRFFAKGCQSQVIDNDVRQSVVVQYSGTGYAWTNLTQRLSFTASGVVEYAADFHVHEDALYIYFRPRQVDATQFNIVLVESPLAQVGISLSAVNPNQMGKDIVESQLRRGFTVIRRSERGETEFALGVVPAGQLPFRPFQVVKSQRVTLDNSRTELHTNQQDFVGGFRVTDDDQSLHFILSLDGAPAVDAFVLTKTMGDLMLNGYVGRTGPATLPGPPLFADVVVPGPALDRRVRLPPGDYYLLLDHSSAAGQAAPPAGPLDDRAARVDYLVQLSDDD